MIAIKDLMDPIEQERYEEFCKKHKDCECSSTIGGKISIIFTPTGLGYIIQCKCNTCNKIENITNDLNW